MAFLGQRLAALLPGAIRNRLPVGDGSVGHLVPESPLREDLGARVVESTSVLQPAVHRGCVRTTGFTLSRTPMY